MIQLTRSGTVLSAPEEAVDSLRAQFDRQHFIRLPGLIEPDLLELIRRQIEQAEFQHRIHTTHAEDECLPKDSLPSSLLNFLFNNSRLFELIRSITGCERIGSFTGRVYRFLSSAGHSDSWHDDMVQNRMIATSVNLGTEVFSGGILQIRDRNSGQVLQAVANPGFGDALVFRLASHLQHRVTVVEGTVHRIAFAGWFRSQPDRFRFLKDLRMAPPTVV
jgi:Rps23 Pro-64 3,4-dihydroxylase Tpa1-like proline 4-hydroxylase